MHHIYLIKSVNHNFTYVGSAINLKRRFWEHNTGKNKSTKFYAPFKLIFYEAYSNKKDAIEREHKLKHHGSAIGHLKKRLRHSLSDK